jgi:hypothetical protein
VIDPEPRCWNSKSFFSTIIFFSFLILGFSVSVFAFTGTDFQCPRVVVSKAILLVLMLGIYRGSRLKQMSLLPRSLVSAAIGWSHVSPT